MYSVHNPTYQAGMQAGLEARFARAARHSRMVRVLRIAVPGAVGLAMAALIGIATFNPFRALASLPLDMDNLVVSGTKITMESPHLAGFTPDKRPYEMQAKTATQDVTDPDHVELHTLQAKVRMEDNSTVTLNSAPDVQHENASPRPAQGYPHAVFDRIRGTANPCHGRYGPGHRHLGPARRCQTAERNADRERSVTEKGDVVRFEKMSSCIW